MSLLPAGQVFWVALPEKHPRGHEQEGVRPCLLVADPARVHPLRFPLLLVAPLTRTRLPKGALYPRLKPGAGGMSQASTVLLDQLTTVDASRVRGLVGAPTAGEFMPIAAGLRALIEG